MAQLNVSTQPSGLILTSPIKDIGKSNLLIVETALQGTLVHAQLSGDFAQAATAIGLPYVYTGSFDTAGKTMMGVHPRDILNIARDIGDGPVAVGANCGVGASDILSTLLDMTAANPEATIVVKGNCGIPEFRGAEIH